MTRSTAMLFPPTTARLTLRRFTPEDLEWFVAFYRDVDVTRHLGGVLDRSAATQLFEERILGYYDRHPGLGIWMTVERATQECLGFHLLNHIRGETIIQVGYALAKPAWGKGFATEMAEAVVRYGFVDVRLPRISGMANLPNVASHRVLEKIGLRRHGERAFSHPAYASQGPMAWFERDAGDWLRERGLGV